MSTVPARSAVADFSWLAVSSNLTARFCLSKQPAGPATKTGRNESDPRLTDILTSVRLDCPEGARLPQDTKKQRIIVNNSLRFKKLIGICLGKICLVGYSRDSHRRFVHFRGHAAVARKDLFLRCDRFKVGAGFR